MLVSDKKASFVKSECKPTNQRTDSHLFKRVDSHRAAREACFLSHSHASPSPRTLDAFCECKALPVSRIPAYLFLPSTHSSEPVEGCLFLRLPHTTEETSSRSSLCRCMRTRSVSTAIRWKQNQLRMRRNAMFGGQTNRSVICIRLIISCQKPLIQGTPPPSRPLHREMTALKPCIDSPDQQTKDALEKQRIAMLEKQRTIYLEELRKRTTLY